MTGLFEGLQAEATQVAVAFSPVIEHFNVIEDIGAGQIAGFVDPFTDALLFLQVEERFGTALFQQLPRDHTRCQVLAQQKRCQSSLPIGFPERSAR